MKSARATPQTDAVTLSICIPIYNQACCLDDLLGKLAVRIGGLRHSYELLIGDNCSSDTTKQAVAKYQDKSNIRYFRRPSNLGSTENLNQFYRNAQGKYVLYRADDDLSVLVEINKNLEIFEHDVAVGVIFASRFIHDLPTRWDITPLYRQDDNYLIEQHDYTKLLALILSYHIFPEICLTRRGVFDRLYFAAPEHAFWAPAHVTEILGSHALYFSKIPFHRPAVRYLNDEMRVQADNEEVKYAWDRYRGGLEYVSSKFAPTLAPNERQGWLNAINQFVPAYTKVALCLRARESGHWIDNYYIANRIKALNEVGDLPTPYDLYRVNVASEYVAKLDPFKPESFKYATLRRAPLQVLHHACDFAGTESMVFDNDVAIPHHTVIVTPIPMDITASAGRKVRFVSEPETFAEFP